ncbi:MAG: hypothetical protein KF845_11210 [Cyclobacteriaceae bacterium]|nr:hypothetical protein [Cyclobacteriaceae bacterium]
MKKSLLFLSVAVLAFSTVFISACSDDDDGGKQVVIPPDLIKSLTIDDTTWEFTYDEANDDRLVSVLVTEGSDDPYTIEYDYSVPGRLTETETASWGTWTSHFVVDNDGRITKALWDASETDDNFDGYEYDANGFLVRIYYKEDGVEHTLERATVVNDNVTEHLRYWEGEVDRTKTFTYLTSASALNVSNLPQTNLRNSERRTIGGLYGKASKGLIDYLELTYPGEPERYSKNTNQYTFDSKNRVTGITRKFADASGSSTGSDEVFIYTYYDRED